MTHGTGNSILLFECRPLSARITEKQCHVNRTRGLFLCGKCAGLDLGAPVEKFEVKGEAMTKHPRCIVAGCGKQRANGKFCRGHFRQYGTEEAYYATAKVQPPDDDNAAQSSSQPPPTASLLSLVPVAPAPAPAESRPGFYLDFTGREDLLQCLQQEIGEDLAADTIYLLQLLHEGKLMRAA